MNAINTEKPRWLYRFDNYCRAFNLLREIIEEMEARPLNQFEKESVIKRFEYTWELAWKTLKDYLEYIGIQLESISPRCVIKDAFSAKIIENGEIWMAALDARNIMSHTYNFKAFEKIIEEIRTSYYPEFERLYSNFLEKAVKDG